MSKIIIKNEDGKEVAYKQMPFLRDTYDIKIGDLEKSAGFFSSGKETRGSIFNDHVWVEDQKDSDSNKRKGIVNHHQKGFFSIDKTLGYETEKYPSFKPDEENLITQKITYGSSSSASSSLEDTFSIPSFLFKFLGMIVVLRLLCGPETKQNKPDPNEKFFYGRTFHNVAGEKVILTETGELQLIYPNLGIYYPMDKLRHVNFYIMMDYNQDGKLMQNDIEKNKSLLSKILERHKIGNLDAVDRDFVDARLEYLRKSSQQ